jgi:hypothetical protein
MFTRHLLIGSCLAVSLFQGQPAQAAESAPIWTSGTDDSAFAENRSDDRYRMQWRRWPADKGVKSKAINQDSKPAAAEKREATILDPERPAKLARFRRTPDPPPAPPPLVQASKPPVPPQKKQGPPQILELAQPDELPRPRVDRNPRSLAREQTAASQPGQPALLAAPRPLERIAPLSGNPLREAGVESSATSERSLQGRSTGVTERGRLDSSGQVKIKWRAGAVTAVQPPEPPALDGSQLRPDMPPVESRRVLSADRQVSFEVNAGSRANPLRSAPGPAVPSRDADDVGPAADGDSAAPGALVSGPSWTANPLRLR